jgi:L-asparaginase II
MRNDYQHDAQAANPVLIEIVRGPMVESVHRGAFAVARADGSVVLSVGDIARPIYPRSAIKPLQALILVESGAADACGLAAEELAIACASHAGAEIHVAAVRSLLAKTGLTEEALACGAHLPQDAASASRAAASGGARQIHNNCSGKHAGWLATAAHLGLPLAGYESESHPLQIMIRTMISDIAGADLASAPCGTDGCSAPNWALPLSALATAIARFGCGDTLAPSRASAASRLVEACFAAPELVAGAGKLDTTLMRRLRGETLVKTGAEGVYVAALPALKLGVALKIDDGTKRAAKDVLVHLLAALLPHRRADLDDLRDRPIANWRGRVTGSVAAAPALRKLLDGTAGSLSPEGRNLAHSRRD